MDLLLLSLLVLSFLCQHYQLVKEFWSKTLLKHFNKLKISYTQPHGMWAAYKLKKHGFKRAHCECVTVLL